MLQLRVDRPNLKVLHFWLLCLLLSSLLSFFVSDVIILLVHAILMSVIGRYHYARNVQFHHIQPFCPDSQA